MTAVVAPPRLPAGIYGKVVSATTTVGTVNLATWQRDSLFTLPAFQQYMYTRGEIVRSFTVPFTRMPLVGVRGGEIYLAEGTNADIRIHDRTGRLLRILRLPFAPTPVTDADWDAQATQLLESRAEVTSGEGRLSAQEVERERRALKDMERPALKPFFDAISLEDPKRIWLKQSASADYDAQRWIAVENDGRIAFIVDLPARLQVHHITDAWVLGVEVDETGVESVVRYALQRER